MKAFWEEIERNEATEKVEKLLWETGGINKQFANYNKYMTCLYCQKSITPEEFANLPNWHTISHLTCYQKKGERSNCLAPRKVVKETNHG
jgi:hypothetical protein